VPQQAAAVALMTLHGHGMVVSVPSAMAQVNTVSIA
jgi:hypothetical protein